MTKKRSIGSRLQSLAYAASGLRYLLKTEPNMLLHLVATILVVIAGIVFDISRGDWLAVSIAIGLVWLAEAFNTCIEQLCDLYTQERHPRVKLIKDIAAGAVLIAAMLALAIGVIVFIF